MNLHQQIEIQTIQGREISPREIMTLIGHEHTKRRKMGGKAGDDHGRNMQITGDGHGMQRPGAARGKKREVAGVIALLDRHLSHGQGHLGQRYLDNGTGRFHGGKP